MTNEQRRKYDALMRLFASSKYTRTYDIDESRAFDACVRDYNASCKRERDRITRDERALFYDVTFH